MRLGPGCNWLVFAWGCWYLLLCGDAGTRPCEGILVHLTAPCKGAGTHPCVGTLVCLLVPLAGTLVCLLVPLQGCWYPSLHRDASTGPYAGMLAHLAGPPCGCKYLSPHGDAGTCDSVLTTHPQKKGLSSFFPSPPSLARQNISLLLSHPLVLSDVGRYSKLLWMEKRGL